MEDRQNGAEDEGKEEEAREVIRNGKCIKGRKSESMKEKKRKA